MTAGSYFYLARDVEFLKGWDFTSPDVEHLMKVKRLNQQLAPAVCHMKGSKCETKQ
jgi:hypothetical protein